jgi:hypothetical protein
MLCGTVRLVEREAGGKSIEARTGRSIMNLKLGVVAVVAVSAVAGMLLARPSFVSAGNTPGLNGRTHLIVKEHFLKHLTGSASGFTPFTVNLFERNRDGSLAGAPYTVPAGRVFIVTDIRLEAVGGGTQLLGDLGIGTGSRWTIDSARENPDHQRLLRESFTGGVAFDPGSSIVYVERVPGSSDVRVDVIGYETVDVP